MTTPMTTLVIDIGGTFMRLALSEDGKTLTTPPQKIRVEQFPAFEDAVLHFVLSANYKPDKILHIRIARSGRNHWLIEDAAITKIFVNSKIAIINDFEANALGLVSPRPDEIVHLGGIKVEPDKTLPRAVIGSGTGLGLAYIHPQGHIQRTHGGHMLPALVGREQIDLFAELQKLKPDRTAPIYEDALSGNGILNIYKILVGKSHLDCAYRDTHHLLSDGRNDPLARQALKFYHEILGQFAHQVLAFGWAYGGLFLTGGITDRLIGHNCFDTDTFLAGLYQDNVPVVLSDVKNTPVFWVRDEFISLRGLLGSSQN